MPPRRKREDHESIMGDFLSTLSDKKYEAKARRGDSQLIYEVNPVDVDTFITSPDYLGQSLYGLSEPQKKVLDYADDFENGINYIILWVGKGGGKDWVTRMIFMRLAYRLLCMRSPHRYFGMPEEEILTFLNVAASSDQARSAFFEPLKGYFRNAGELAFRRFGFNPDWDIKDKSIKLPKNINIESGHSEADSLEGKHLLVAVADEIDGTAFKKPDKMWTMLRSSSRSRFSGKEKVFAISYMRYGDSQEMISRLYDQYTGMPNAQTFKFPTWEFNPNPSVTRESLQDHFDQNPEEAECIYACNPPSAGLDAFIKDYERVKRSMKKHPDRHPLKFPLPPETFATYPLTEVEQVVDGESIRINPYDLQFQDWFKGKKGVDYIFVGDPGLGSVANGGDAYGICLGHREIVYDENGKKMVRPFVDFVFRFTGHMFEEREIQFDAIKKLIVKLKEDLGFNITIFSFDAWNAADIRQWLKRRYAGNVYVNNDRKYVKYEDFALLRQRIFGEEPPSSGNGERMNNGGINWYYHPILAWEIKNLQEDRSKNKIDHKPNTSKDVVDPIASFVYFSIYKFPNMGVEFSAGSLNRELEVAKTQQSIGGNKDLDFMLKSIDKLARDLRAPTEEEKVGYD